MKRCRVSIDGVCHKQHNTDDCLRMWCGGKVLMRRVVNSLNRCTYEVAIQSTHDTHTCARAPHRQDQCEPCSASRNDRQEPHVVCEGPRAHTSTVYTGERLPKHEQCAVSCLIQSCRWKKHRFQISFLRLSIYLFLLSLIFFLNFGILDSCCYWALSSLLWRHACHKASCF